MLRIRFTEVRAVRASCVVSSRGVRLPFETDSRVSVAANADALYPICEWIGIENDRYTSTKKEYINRWRQVKIGSPGFSEATAGNDKSNSFSNIHARCAGTF